MELKINYEEIERYVADRYGVRVTLAGLPENTLRVTVTKRVIFNLNFDVEIDVVKITPDTITLAYDGSIGIDMIISGALRHIVARLPDNGSPALTLGPDQTVELHLSNIPRLRPLLSHLSPSSLIFGPSSLTLSAAVSPK